MLSATACPQVTCSCGEGLLAQLLGLTCPGDSGLCESPGRCLGLGQGAHSSPLFLLEPGSCLWLQLSQTSSILCQQAARFCHIFLNDRPVPCSVMFL